MRAADGTIMTIDISGAIGTVANAINDEGTIAGFYDRPDVFSTHGFLRAADGTIASFDVPGAPGTFAGEHQQRRCRYRPLCRPQTLSNMALYG